jgi:mRNA interferase MazF
MTSLDVFDHWNAVKKKIETHRQLIFFAEHEIWWCSLGKNIGHEQDGKNHLFERPVLILRKFSQRLFLAIPLTSSLKNNMYSFLYSFNGLQRSAVLSQIRLLDAKRLQRKIGMMNQENFKSIRLRVKT